MRKHILNMTTLFQMEEHIAKTYAYGRLVECCEECHEYLVEYPEAREIICMCITTISCIQTSVPGITKMHDIAILS